MTHNLPDTDRIKSFRELDHVNLDGHIDAEAAHSTGVDWPTPEQRIRDELPAAEIRRVVLPDESDVSRYWWRRMISTGASVVGAPLYSLIATAFVMALVGMILPTTVAPIGIAAMFVLSIPISTIYWIRYHRDEQLHDALDELQDRIIEMEQAITERLDVVVRNA